MVYRLSTEKEFLSWHHYICSADAFIIGNTIPVLLPIDYSLHMHCINLTRYDPWHSQDFARLMSPGVGLL